MCKLRILPLLAGLALLFACEKQPQADTSLAVTPRSTWLEAEAGTVFVTVTANADWTLRLEFPSGTPAWASIGPEAGSGNRADVVLRFDANESENSREVNLVLTGLGNEVSVKVNQSGKAVDPGPGPGPGSGGYGYDVAPAGLDWLELPAMLEGDGRELLIHDMKGGRYTNREKNGVRNWSCYWDYDDRVALWVAYPHNNSLKGSGNRTDSWGYDPLLPNDAQYSITQSFPSTHRYYSDALYDRGHQIPSADRLTYAANVSTFYPTNMTPQSKSFNSGIWANLENKVRSYISTTDTVYVVTGCLIDNSSLKVTSYNGKSITVPTHYFKALLAHTTGGTYGVDGYLAAGFLLPHSEGIAKESFLNYICSIDELEQKTGIDFFPNLIKKLGQGKADQIEAEAPSKWWR